MAQLTINLNMTDNKPVTVTGEQVTLPHLQGVTFVLHHSVENKRRWTISESESGRSVVAEAKTQVEAREKLERKLAGVDGRAFRAAINAQARRKS